MRELQSHFLNPLKIHSQTQANHSFSAMQEFLLPYFLTKEDNYAGT